MHFLFFIAGFQSVVPVHQHVQQQDAEPGSAKWNALVINASHYTRVSFPVMTCQYVCSREGQALKSTQLQVFLFFFFFSNWIHVLPDGWWTPREDCWHTEILVFPQQQRNRGKRYFCSNLRDASLQSWKHKTKSICVDKQRGKYTPLLPFTRPNSSVFSPQEIIPGISVDSSPSHQRNVCV